jgi:hypothetical protein
MALATAERQEWLVQQMDERGIAYRHASFSWVELADSLCEVGDAQGRMKGGRNQQ